MFLTVRSLEKGKTACSSFLEPGRVELLEMDTSSVSSVRKAAAELLSKSATLNILVCNAGIMLVPTREMSVDGFESQFATNYLGHFLLFWLLKDAMLEASTPEFNSRLVHVASAGHHGARIRFEDLNFEEENCYDGGKAYGQSKLAQIYMANYVDRVFGPKGLHAWSLMPGGILTNLQQHIAQETKDGWNADPKITNFLKSKEQGAATTVLAAVSREWEGQGGKYLEDCQPSKECPLIPWTIGHVPSLIYNKEDEDRLWGLTLSKLGLRES